MMKSKIAFFSFTSGTPINTMIAGAAGGAGLGLLASSAYNKYREAATPSTSYERKALENYETAAANYPLKARLKDYASVGKEEYSPEAEAFIQAEDSRNKALESRRNRMGTISPSTAGWAGIALGTTYAANRLAKQGKLFSYPNVPGSRANFMRVSPGIVGAMGVDALGRAATGGLLGAGVAGLRNRGKATSWSEEERRIMAMGTPEEKAAMAAKLNSEGRRVSYRKAAGIGAGVNAGIGTALSLPYSAKLNRIENIAWDTIGSK